MRAKSVDLFGLKSERKSLFNLVFNETSQHFLFNLGWGGRVKPLVSVIIPTYKRAHTLKYVLEGLKGQTYRNFEVVVVFKAAGDSTEEVLKEYGKDLPIKTIMQKDGFITDAYNLGLKEANGQIIAFLDDDAVPYPNWLEEHVRIYNEYREVGGISGTTKSASIRRDEKIIQIPEGSIYPYSRKQRHYDFPWASPIRGMSSYLIFFGKDGLVHHHPRLENKNIHEVFPSLLHMGANMSVRKEAIKGLEINEDLILGFAFEQLLSYQIWRLGYKLLYNPNANVLHLVHSESTGRFFKTPRRAALRDAEFVLTFSILKSREKEFSWVAYILGITTLTISRLMRAREYGLLISIYRVYGLLSGFVTGCAYMISKTLKRSFPIRTSLSRLLPSTDARSQLC